MRLTVIISALILYIWLQGASAMAETGSKIDFDIPAQSLSSALLRFSESTGIKTFFPVNIVRDLRAPAVSGSYTPIQALEKLLKNSGIDYRFTETGSVTLITQTSQLSKELLLSLAPKENYASDMLLADAASYTGPVEQEEMTVQGGEWSGYNAINASSATKTDTPIMETPFSINVVPQKVIQDQQIINIRDSLRNVAGVVAWGASQNVADTFISRGFPNHRGVYRDGYMFYDIVGCCPTGLRETANVERIEFLKGPASILFGRAEPGGIINLITKQPLATPHYSLQQQIGSYDFYRTTLDATGPLTSDDTLLYRLNLAYQDANSFREFVESNHVFVAPKLRWNISPSTQVTLELEYMHNEDTPDLGNIPFALGPTGNKPSPLPRERNIGEKWSDLTGDRILVGLDWSHKFNENWTLHHRFNTERFDNVFIGVFSPSAAPDGTARRGFFDVDPSKGERYFTVLDLTGNFETWGIKHSVLLGGDYFRADEQYFENFSLPGGSLPDTNIFNPFHQPQQPTITERIDQLNNTTEWYGLYFQDQLELPFNVHLLGGFRYDSAEISNNLQGGVVVSEDDRVSPRGGIVWRPMPWLSLYGSYTENFGASNGQLASNGSFLPSQTAQQWEAGFKTELLDGRLSGTFAYFDLTKQNQRTTDPLNPTRALLVGESESRGLEVDISGELLPGWNIIATYAYTPFAKVTKGNELSFPAVGNRFQGTPEHSGSVWSSYEFQEGNLNGLTLGAGVVAVDERVGNNANTFSIPGYAIVNLMGRYEWKVGSTLVSAQLNIENLLDKTYALGTNGGGHIPFGAPRTFLGSIKVEF